MSIDHRHVVREAAIAKSASFGVMHIGIASGVSDALPGRVTIAGAITLIEPLVNAVAQHFVDRCWTHPALRARGRWACARPLPARA